MHNVTQSALQVVTHARQDTKIYPGNLVLTVLLQLCPLDTGTKNNGGMCAYTAKGQMVKEFEDWCFDASRQKGDTGLVKTKFGYHIMYFVTGGEGWIRLSESGVRDEKSTALLKEITEKDEMQTDFKSIVLGQSEIKSAS